jgi:hypothetical protein
MLKRLKTQFCTALCKHEQQTRRLPTDTKIRMCNDYLITSMIAQYLDKEYLLGNTCYIYSPNVVREQFMSPPLTKSTTNFLS